MPLIISTGLRDHILVTGSFKAGVDGGVIRVYAGTVPTTADAALTGTTLLCTISNNSAGTGITMNSVSAGGVLAKNPAEVWSGIIAVSGTASFYRYSPLADDFSLSTTIKRLQGGAGTAGFDLNFSNVAFVSGNARSIDTFDVAQPTK